MPSKIQVICIAVGNSIKCSAPVLHSSTVISVNSRSRGQITNSSRLFARLPLCLTFTLSFRKEKVSLSHQEGS